VLQLTDSGTCSKVFSETLFI